MDWFFVPVRPRTRVTLTSLTGALEESIVKFVLLYLSARRVVLKSEIWQKIPLGRCEKWTAAILCYLAGFSTDPVVGNWWGLPADKSHVLI